MKKSCSPWKKVVNLLFSVLSHVVFTCLLTSGLLHILRIGCLVMFHSYTQSNVIVVGAFLVSSIFSLRHYRPYPFF